MSRESLHIKIDILRNIFQIELVKNFNNNYFSKLNT